MKKLIALLLAVVVFIPTAFAEETSFESLVLDIIKRNPQIVKDALENYEKELAKKREQEEFNKLLAEKVEIDIGDSPIRGNKKAEYTLIAFSDFQCPFCKKGDATAREFLKNHEGKIKYIFKHYPLSFHPEAAPASKATWAAGKQGKFYEYHDKLFENQAKLGEELYVQIAKELELDVEKFNKDRNGEEAEKKIQADMKQAQEVGIQGTPGFILNGVKILGAYPLDHFEKVISALETTAKK